MTLDKTQELFAAAGLDFDALYKSAARADFRPVALKARANLHVTNELRDVDSVQRRRRDLTARTPSAAMNGVIYSAHWDHFGRNPKLIGNQIFHGAEDNASGVAGLLEIAKAFKALPRPPARSILFIGVTSEEQGLLGANWYATHPVVSAGAHGRGHQYGRTERMGTHARSDDPGHGPVALWRTR